MTIIGNIGGSKNKIGSGWSTELSQGRIGMSASSIIRIGGIFYKINEKHQIIAKAVPHKQLKKNFQLSS